jgi:PIN domain nuclease of toxin-antitoxin system
MGDLSKLSERAHQLLLDPQHEVMVSGVSAIEVAIKRNLGKLEFPGSLAAGVKAAGFNLYAIGFEVAEQLERLPHHHRDPFDRLLIAHALHMGVPLVTRDPEIQRYALQTIW